MPVRTDVDPASARPAALELVLPHCADDDRYLSLHTSRVTRVICAYVGHGDESAYLGELSPRDAIRLAAAAENAGSVTATLGGPDHYRQLHFEVGDTITVTLADEANRAQTFGPADPSILEYMLAFAAGD